MKAVDADYIICQMEWCVREGMMSENDYKQVKGWLDRAPELPFSNVTLEDIINRMIDERTRSVTDVVYPCIGGLYNG